MIAGQNKLLRSLWDKINWVKLWNIFIVDLRSVAIKFVSPPYKEDNIMHEKIFTTNKFMLNLLI